MSDGVEGEGEVYDFPCVIPLKAIGRDEGDFSARVRAAVEGIAGSVPDAAVSARPSKGGRFVSITVAVEVQDRPQLEALYAALKRVEGVDYLL